MSNKQQKKKKQQQNEKTVYSRMSDFMAANWKKLAKLAGFLVCLFFFMLVLALQFAPKTWPAVKMERIKPSTWSDHSVQGIHVYETAVGVEVDITEKCTRALVLISQDQGPFSATSPTSAKVRIHQKEPFVNGPVPGAGLYIHDPALNSGLVVMLTPKGQLATWFSSELAKWSCTEHEPSQQIDDLDNFNVDWNEIGIIPEGSGKFSLFVNKKFIRALSSPYLSGLRYGIVAYQPGKYEFKTFAVYSTPDWVADLFGLFGLIKLPAILTIAINMLMKAGEWFFKKFVWV